MDTRAEQRRLRRDIVWNLAPVVLLGVVGLGINFAIGAWWGTSALGAFNLVTITFFSFAVLGAWGIQYSVLRAVAEVAHDRDRVAPIVVGALIPTVGIAALATCAYLLLRGPLGDLQGPAVAEGMLWVAPGLFCFAINKVLLGIVNGLRRMRVFAVYTSLRYLLIGAGLGLARAWDLDGDQLPVIWTFTEGALLLVLAVELFATVPLARGARWRAEARRHLGFGARGVTATLAYEVNSKLDVWMLGNAVSNAHVGIYSLAAAVYEGVVQLAVVVQNNLNPIVAQQVAAGDQAAVEALVRRTRRWFVPALAGACLVGAAVYPYIIPLMTGDDAFASGARSFAIMMAGVALASPYLPFLQVLLMAGRPGWHTAYVLATTTTNLVACLVLIPRWGLEGAAIATSVALVASALLLRGFARRYAGVRI